MFHRRFFFGRILFFMLLIGGLFSVGRGLFRSGYEQGFVQGMSFAADTAQPDAPGASSAPRVYGHWRGGPLGPVERGFMGFSLIGFAFLAFLALMFFGALGRRHQWAGHGPDRHGRHDAPWGRHGRHGRGDHQDDIGPEKQPEDYL